MGDRGMTLTHLAALATLSRCAGEGGEGVPPPRDLSRHALHEGGGCNDWDFPERVER
jgi:hypothetical protein